MVPLVKLVRSHTVYQRTWWLPMKNTVRSGRCVGLPAGTIPEKVGLHAVAQDRALKDGKLNFYWVMCNNNMQAGPNINQERMPGWRDPRNFIVVSDPIQQ
ncbi:hypothetical protein J4731_20855 [Providencia rettgeri]|nr:hypothetical protein [Providencia rettgeri]